MLSRKAYSWILFVCKGNYFLPLFDRPKINIVFSNTLKLDPALQTRSTIQKLFFREKETKHRFLFGMPHLLQIF